MTAKTIQASFSGGEISPALAARSDLQRYQTALAECRNFIIHKAGGASNRAGFEFLGEVENHDYCPTLIPFRFDNQTQICVLEMGEKSMRVWYEGALVISNGAPLSVATPYGAAEAATLGYVQSGNVVYFAHPDHPPQKLSRVGWNEWRFDALDMLPTIETPAAGQAAVSGSVGAKATITASYKISAISDESGEESLASEAFSVNGAPTPEDWPAAVRIKLSWTAEEGKTYNVFKDINGIYGSIGQAVGGEFADTNIVPDISSTAPMATNPFSGAGNYPGQVALHQQRLVFAASANRPNGIWASRVGFFENFSKSSPPKDDDAISVAIGSGEINAVVGLVSIQDLIVLTSGSENVVNGGESRAAITPASISIFPQSYWGASALRPLVSGNTVLFVQEKGGAVRDLAYEYSVDGFSGNDKTIFSAHLLQGRKIVSWCYCQTPESTVWMALDNGALLSMTYFKEQDVGGWARHDTNGLFERVLSLPGDGQDELYAVARRLVNGQWRRYVERMAKRTIKSNRDAKFMDSFLVYEGAPAAVIGGLSHLEGMMVAALAEGDVIPEQPVKDGAIRLPKPYGYVVVGLSYEGTIRTLDINGADESGALQGRRVNIANVTALTEMSREFRYGPDQDHLFVTPIRVMRWGEQIPPENAAARVVLTADWRSGGSFVIRPNGPTPLTILALIPSISTGRI